MRCDYCGEAGARPYVENRDYISGEVFPIVACQTCGLLRTALEALPDDWSRYYGPAYYGKDQAGRRFPAPIEAYLAWSHHRRVAPLVRQHPGGGRALEIGCGRGLTLAALQAQGWEAVGTEVDPAMAAAVQARYGFPVHVLEDLRAGDFPAGSFDAVMMWHVWEHLPQPFQTLAEIRRILRPGGLLLLEVPNNDSQQARMAGGAWFHLDTPRHLYHFGVDWLSQALPQHGFQMVERGTFSFEQGFYGYAQSYLNRVCAEPNALYAWLKGYPPRRRDGLLSLALGPWAAAGAVMMESLAVLRGRGAVIRLLARAD
jgi:SAM-dependent methyltransferase